MEVLLNSVELLRCHSLLDYGSIRFADIHMIFRTTRILIGAALDVGMVYKSVLGRAFQDSNIFI